MRLNKTCKMYVKLSYNLVFILVLSFLFSGCDTGILRREPERVTGTEGLVVNFIRAGMPSRIYEEEPFFIQLRLRNEGALDINDGVLFVSVNPTSVFSIENKDEYERFSLRGDDGIFRGEDIVSIIELSSKKFLPDGVTARDVNIKIDACYEYGTFFEDNFCIDTDLVNQIPNKPCRMVELSGLRGQGAPVVVSRIIPRASRTSDGARISFDIYIYNSGSGVVLRTGSSNRVCTGSFNLQDMNLVTISEIKLSRYSLSSESIKCDSHTQSPNEFDLRGSREFITCRITEDIDFSRGTFTTPITIELEYGYVQSLETEVMIQKYW